MNETANFTTEEWEFLCDVSKEVCGFQDGQDIGHYPTYWYPPREWCQDPIHKGKWNPLRSLEQAREVWLWAKKIVPSSDYSFDFETVTPTEVCEEALRIVRNARWCGVAAEVHVWRCICNKGHSQIRMNRGCDLCTIEELPE